MNADIKHLWVEALRSGEYKQGKGALYRDPDVFPASGGFCCLGVLCDLAVKAGATVAVSGEGFTIYGSGVYGNCSVPPSDVQHWAGLDRAIPYVNVAGVSRLLSACNDDGMGFAEIADLIEAQL